MDAKINESTPRYLDALRAITSLATADSAICVWGASGGRDKDVQGGGQTQRSGAVVS
jgi:hypothetical protein